MPMLAPMSKPPWPTSRSCWPPMPAARSAARSWMLSRRSSAHPPVEVRRDHQVHDGQAAGLDLSYGLLDRRPELLRLLDAGAEAAIEASQARVVRLWRDRPAVMETRAGGRAFGVVAQQGGLH